MIPVVFLRTAPIAISPSRTFQNAIESGTSEVGVALSPFGFADSLPQAAGTEEEAPTTSSKRACRMPFAMSRHQRRSGPMRPWL
jgi:hypothetical protein